MKLFLLVATQQRSVFSSIFPVTMSPPSGGSFSSSGKAWADLIFRCLIDYSAYIIGNISMEKPFRFSFFEIEDPYHLILLLWKRYPLSEDLLILDLALLPVRF